jgi:hypothetical protein
MKTCPYCSSDVPNSARTCTMCGTGLPATLRSNSGSIVPMLIAIVLIGGLAVAAFLLGEWRADTTTMTASAPVAAPPPETAPSKPQPAAPTAPAAAEPAPGPPTAVPHSGR